MFNRAAARADAPPEAIAGVEPGLRKGRGVGRDRAVCSPDAHDHRLPDRHVVRVNGGALDLVVGRAGNRVPAQRGEAVRLLDGHARDLIGLLGERRSGR
jgi:hypothetical protein